MVIVSSTLKTKKADHFPAVVTMLSKCKKLSEILGKLTKRQQRIFKQSCLGHFLDLQFLSFSGNLVHKILLHEVEIDGDEQEMWFLIGETPMRFSRIEFALITGLTFGPYPEVSVDSHRLQDLYFGLKPAPNLDDIDSAFYAFDFTAIDDMDAVKITLYYVLERVVIGRAERYLADLWLMGLVDNLDEFNKYPWGSVCWRYTYRSLSRALRGQVGHYRVKLTEAKAKGKSYSSTYNLDGFPVAFQIWIYEVLPTVGRQFARCTNQRLPRMLRWMAATKNIRDGMLRTHVLSPSTPLIVRQQIDPTEEERMQPYYLQVVRFLGVDEGEYGGTIFMDDQTPTEIPSPPVEAADMSPPIIPDTAETFTPIPPADVDQTDTTFPTPDRPKKRSRPRRPSRHTEYREELFGDDPDDHAADTHADPPLQSHDVFSRLDMLRVDLQVFSARHDTSSQQVLDSLHTLIQQIRGIVPPDDRRDGHVDAHRSTSAHVTDLPRLDDQAQFCHVYWRTTSRRPAYANPIRQQLGGLVRSWPQYGPGSQMSPLRLVSDTLFGRWLDDGHISEYIAMLSHRQLVCREIVPQHWTVVSLHLYTALQVTYTGYLSGALAEGTFYPNSDIESFVMGRHCRLHRDWVQVDVVYLPLSLGGDHWVACEIHFRRREITVYDSLPSAHGDADIDSAMQPLCIYIPYLLHQTGFYRYRTDVTERLTPFTFIRPRQGIPQQRSDSGDCGIFTCMFIQYLGLGRPFDFGPEDGVHMRTRVAVDLWAGQLL
ncbi:Phospholipase-like protein [Melia azedarach]|uniref:Phospholipase-like protein n=1 Tax=Melia azedarach TaxID=155640 RepID=A0ACC1YWI7_MELAZ|nr:Phospholipase-like protein [Melia azedarach]